MDLADRINPQGHAGGYGQFDGKWRVTEAIGCPGALIHRALGCESEEIDDETMALFGEGFLHEDWFKAKLREDGLTLVEFPDGIAALDAPLIGHPDNLWLEENEVIEYKSVYDADDSEEFMATHKRYNKQLQSYLRILGRQKGRILVKSRKTGWVLPDIKIEHDAAITDVIWKNAVDCKALLDKGIVSCNQPWLPSCSSDFMTRMWCPFYGVHCRITEAQATVELDMLLSQYAATKIVSDELTSKVGVIRDTIKETMKSGGLERVKNSEGVGASLYMAHWPLTDKDKAEEYLSIEQFKEVFRQGSTPDALRVTIPKGLRKNGNQEPETEQE